LDQRAKELNLGLAPAQPLQVVRLAEMPVGVLPDQLGSASAPSGRWKRRDAVDLVKQFIGRRP
jgi:hypothetical protein